MPGWKKTAPLPPLNIIERHADQFVDSELGRNADSLMQNNPREFVNDLKNRLYDYNKYAERIIYAERVRYRVKIGMDNHDSGCPKFQNGERCHKHESLEDILFFVQNIIEDFQGMIEPEAISPQNRIDLEIFFESIRRDLDILKTSAEFSYNDIMEEINEVKSYIISIKRTCLRF